MGALQNSVVAEMMKSMKPQGDNMPKNTQQNKMEKQRRKRRRRKMRVEKNEQMGGMRFMPSDASR